MYRLAPGFLPLGHSPPAHRPAHQSRCQSVRVFISCCRDDNAQKRLAHAVRADCTPNNLRPLTPFIGRAASWPPYSLQPASTLFYASRDCHRAPRPCRNPPIDVSRSSWVQSAPSPTARRGAARCCRLRLRSLLRHSRPICGGGVVVAVFFLLLCMINLFARATAADER